MRKSDDHFPKADSKQSLPGTHAHTYIHPGVIMCLVCLLQMLVNTTSACCFAPHCNNNNSTAIKAVGSSNKNGGINKHKIYETVACSPHSSLLNCMSKRMFLSIHAYISTTHTIHTYILYTYLYVHLLVQVGIGWMLHENFMHNNWNSNNCNIVSAAAATAIIKECWWSRKSGSNKKI